ncbi:MAG: smalltalk protein [Bacteroidales bacterium]|nr:smalltalk protein [Bacteroidales bacterium]
MNQKQALDELNNVLSNNPDPDKWSMWIKIIIAVLSAILGVIGENKLDLVTNLSNLF